MGAGTDDEIGERGAMDIPEYYALGICSMPLECSMCQSEIPANVPASFMGKEVWCSKCIEAVRGE